MEAIQARYAKAERQFLNLAGVDADPARMHNVADLDGNKVCYPFQTGTASKLEALGMVEAYKGNLLK
jgi:hypothetical protein